MRGQQFIINEIKLYIKDGFLWYLMAYFFVRLMRVKNWIGCPEFILNYTTDFLCLPILIPLTISVLNILVPHNKFKLTFSIVTQVALLYSVLFEYILPRYSLAYTADYVDALMYFLGGCFYWLMTMKNRRK